MEMQDSLEKLDIDIMKGYEKEIYEINTRSGSI